MGLKLIYYYSDSCGSCKDYSDVVDRLSTALRIEAQKRDIGIEKPQHKLQGIPTLILENNGVEIYRSLGNASFQQVYKDMKDYI